MTGMQSCALPPMQIRKWVIAEFAQSLTSEIATFPDGFCAGLTLHWLALRLVGKDWPAKQTDPAIPPLTAAAATTYAVYQGANDAALRDASAPAILFRGVTSKVGLMETVPLMQQRKSMEAAAPPLGLRLDPSFDPMIWEPGKDGHTFIHEVVVRGVGFYYLGMTARIPGKADGSHGIGLQIYKSSTVTDCEFFDPNLGQIHFDEPNDVKWAFYDFLNCYRKVHSFDFYKGVVFRFIKK